MSFLKLQRWPTGMICPWRKCSESAGFRFGICCISWLLIFFLKSPYLINPLYMLEIFAKDRCNACCPSIQEIVSLDTCSVDQLIHDYVKTHASCVHLLGVEKSFMYLYSICRIGSWNITLQPPWDLKGKNTSSPTQRFFKHFLGGHLVWYVFHSHNMEVKNDSLEVENPFHLFQIMEFMDVEKPLANSQVLWKCDGACLSFSAKSEAVFYHQHKSPGQAPLLNESFALPSFTGTFALECPYLNRLYI